MTPRYAVAVFVSTHDAMLAQRALEKQFAVLAMPAPRSLNAACGLALRFAPEIRTEVAAILDALLKPESYQIAEF